MVPPSPITRRGFLGGVRVRHPAHWRSPRPSPTTRRRNWSCSPASQATGRWSTSSTPASCCWRNASAAYEGLEVVHHNGGWPDSEKAFEGADGIFLYADGGNGHPFIQGNHLSIIGDSMKRGVGLMCAHFAVEVPKDKGGKELCSVSGSAATTRDQFSCNPMWVPDLQGVPGTRRITRGVKPFAIEDEWYFNMRFRPEMKGVTTILSAKPSDATRDGPYVYPRGPYKHIQEAKGRAETMMWAVERSDGGRGVGFPGGHFHKNWADDNFRKVVVLNAAVWICKADVPKDGIESKVTDEEIKDNLDPKGK